MKIVIRVSLFVLLLTALSATTVIIWGRMSRSSRIVHTSICREIVPMRACISDLVVMKRWGRKILMRYTGEVPFSVDTTQAKFDPSGNIVKITQLPQPKVGAPCNLKSERVLDNVDENLFARCVDYDDMYNKEWQKEQDAMAKVVNDQESLLISARENTLRLFKAFYSKIGKDVDIQWSDKK